MSRESSFSPMKITSSTLNQWMPQGPVSRARRPLSPPEVRVIAITLSVWHMYLLFGEFSWAKSSHCNRNSCKFCAQRKISWHKFRGRLKLVSWIHCADQQKAAWFEGDIWASRASSITILLKMDLSYPWNFTNLTNTFS